MTTEIDISKPENQTILLSLMPQGSTKEELILFARHCQKTGLDPFSRQIYPMKRYDQSKQREVISFQISIDGFRVIAERNGQYAGQVGPFWCGDDGKWVDVWLSDKAPRAAKIGVLRKDFAEPLFAVALFEEYVQKKRDGSPTSMWVKMAANQIAKCAESLALRRAFPNDLSGFYTTEEMAQASPPKEEDAESATKEPEKRNSKKLLAEIQKDPEGQDSHEKDPEEQEIVDATFTPGKNAGPMTVSTPEEDAEKKIKETIDALIKEGKITPESPTKLQFVTVLAAHGISKEDMPSKCKKYMSHHFGKNKWDELTEKEQRRTFKDAMGGMLNEPVLL